MKKNVNDLIMDDSKRGDEIGIYKHKFLSQQNILIEGSGTGTPD